MGEWRYSSTIFTSALDGGEPPAPIGYEAGWAPEPVWTLWIREKSLTLLGIEPQPVVLTELSQLQACIPELYLTLMC
jgi:hypothetical protein